MAGDFPKQELQAYKLRVERALVTTFRGAGYEVFDVTMEKKPQAVSADLADFWGGYAIEFKAIEKTQFNKFANDIEQLRRNAMMLGQGSKFLIDISSFEYTLGKQRRDFGGYTIFVYSPAMMICEKLRAICQQTQEYRPIIKRQRAGSPRARDFLDIYSLVTECKIDMTATENCELLQHIFDAKKVPVSFLRFVPESKDFHRANWAAVRDSIKPGVKVKDYEFYFDFVVALVERLKPFWNM